MMKRIFALLSMLFCATVHADTIGLTWLVDGQTYDTSTCENGGDLILPNQTPTKYGHVFRGWELEIIYGTWSQSGTPTPSNPIEPVFYPLGNTVLRALGTGNNTVADTYNPATGLITRRVGVKVLDGTENWGQYTYGSYKSFRTNFIGAITTGDANRPIVCSHFKREYGAWTLPNIGIASFDSDTSVSVYFRSDSEDVAQFKQWLVSQYNNGRPVTCYYPLATPVEEYYQPN